MADHTPPPDDSVPSGDPYSSAPKVPPGQPSPGNPYTSQPPFGQQPGPYPAGQAPLAPGEERTWVLVSHLSFFVLSVLGPLIVMLVFGKRSEYVRRQSMEALNFHLTVLIACVVSIPLMFVLIGFLTFFAALVYGMVMSVIAAVQISNGVDFRYPATLRLIS